MVFSQMGLNLIFKNKKITHEKNLELCEAAKMADAAIWINPTILCV